ncbi:HAUS augmin-like complex subunit 2 isoform X1 [Amblyraja radiata]|uniref:HAUS augmin-like complex subunit 2 isoform X1 n=2 Tax=Amblyraja radiata TaxID=386614 RepID=UPI0014033BBB|nr:HAUS augmin-like complex subunit 2 isoform X1 [Amblyraja radiata]
MMTFHSPQLVFQPRLAARMQAGNPWEPAAPNPAARFLQRCLTSGALSQEDLDWNNLQFENSVPFIQRFKLLDAVSHARADLQQKSLDMKLLQLQTDTADIAHPEYLAKKYRNLQLMNSHLERIVQEKTMLKQRLVKPICHQCLPVEANYHRYVCELLTITVQVIEKLDTYLQFMKSIPLLPLKVKLMTDLGDKFTSVILELKRVLELILKWRDQQKTVSLEYMQ